MQILRKQQLSDENVLSVRTNKRPPQKYRGLKPLSIKP